MLSCIFLWRGVEPNLFSTEVCCSQHFPAAALLADGEERTGTHRGDEERKGAGCEQRRKSAGVSSIPRLTRPPLACSLALSLYCRVAPQTHTQNSRRRRFACRVHKREAFSSCTSRAPLRTLVSVASSPSAPPPRIVSHRSLPPLLLQPSFPPSRSSCRAAQS